MRALFVGSDPPWPVTSGHAVRMVHTTRGLARAFRVDVLTLTDPWRPESFKPAEEPAASWWQVARPRASRPAWVRWTALRPGARPRALAGRASGSARADVARLGLGPYDVVWVHRADTMHLLGPALPAGPRVLDLDDLEDRKALLRSGMLRDDAANAGLASRVQAAVRAGLSSRDARAWRRVQSEGIRQAARVVVASPMDARRLGIAAPDATVVPNGAEGPGERWREARANRQADGGPVVVFHGLLTYPPNVDAAKILARRVAPVLRRTFPDISVRLVGRARDDVAALHDPPRVVVTGFVDALEEELASADVVVVPIRYGGGTRIKIIEAWAYEIPVVSTTVGAEGLDARDGIELMIADDPAELARVCGRVLTEPDLRSALVGGGRRRYEEVHRWCAIEETVAAVAAEVANFRSVT